MFKDLEGNYPKQLHLLRLMLFYQGSRRAALKVTVRFSIRVAMFRRLTLQSTCRSNCWWNAFNAPSMSRCSEILNRKGTHDHMHDLYIYICMHPHAHKLFN